MSDRKNQITQAALAVFALYGLRKTSMQDVAVQAGLSRPALYQYFRNKEDLIAACVDWVTEDGFANAEAAMKDGTPKVARVTAYLTAYMTYYHRLLISGPHSEDVLAIKTRFDKSKINPTRKMVVQKINLLAGLSETNQIGVILVHGSEGLKLLATDEDALSAQISALVAAFIPA